MGATRGAVRATSRQKECASHSCRHRPPPRVRPPSDVIRPAAGPGALYTLLSHGRLKGGLPR